MKIKPKPITGKELTSRFRQHLIQGITSAEINDLLQALGWVQGMLSVRVGASGIPTADVLAIGAKAREQFLKGQADMETSMLRSKNAR
jgi:hypothetical protein